VLEMRENIHKDENTRKKYRIKEVDRMRKLKKAKKNYIHMNINIYHYAYTYILIDSAIAVRKTLRIYPSMHEAYQFQTRV